MTDQRAGPPLPNSPARGRGAGSDGGNGGNGGNGGLAFAELAPQPGVRACAAGANAVGQRA